MKKEDIKELFEQLDDISILLEQLDDICILLEKIENEVWVARKRIKNLKVIK